MTENVQRVKELEAQRAELVRQIDGAPAGAPAENLLDELSDVDTALREAGQNVGLEDVRARVRAELLAVAFVPLDDELAVHDLNALVDAYRGLAGDLDLKAEAAEPDMPAPRLNPDDVVLREKLRGVAWQAANEAGVPVAAADDIAGAVSDYLEDLGR